MKEYSNKIIRNIIPDDIIEKDADYEKVIEIIDDLWKGQIIQNGSGYCLAMSDLLYNLLSHFGIECELVECSLLVIKKNLEVKFVGLDSNRGTDENLMKNHVVCIVKTKVPIFIDIGIYGQVENVPYVISTLNGDEKNNSLAKVNIDGNFFRYSKKSVSTIPQINQRGIVDKINFDNRVKKEIKYIKLIVSIAFCVSTLNFVRGLYDHYQKYINKDNGFGPNKIHVIYEEPESKRNERLTSN